MENVEFGLVVNIIVCLIIAHFIGTKKVMGFWWSLFFCFFFTPILGFFIVLFSTKNKGQTFIMNKSDINVGWFIAIFSFLILIISVINIDSSYSIINMSGITFIIGFIGVGIYLVFSGKGLNFRLLELKKKDFINFYDVLDISETANSEEIEKAFSFKNKDQTNASSSKGYKYNDIMEAYFTLKDLKKREKYNTLLNEKREKK